MADAKISAFNALTGANVDTAADVLAIVDTGAGETKKILAVQLGIALGTPKVWCRFNSAGTVSESYNTTSITDSGTGDWTVVVATDFASTTWVPIASCGHKAGVGYFMCNIIAIAAGTCNINTAIWTNGAKADPDTIDAITFVGFGAQ